MTQPLYVQIHTLMTYGPSLLNRDDLGFAKRIPFGDAERVYISSQCAKRAWRRHDGPMALARASDSLELKAKMSVRSRHIFDELIGASLVKEGASVEVVLPVVRALRDVVLGKSEKAAAREEADAEDAASAADDAADPARDEASAKGKGRKAPKKEKVDGIDSLMTKQVVVMGESEIGYLRGLASRLCREAKDVQDVPAWLARTVNGELLANLRVLSLGAGIDAAMCGRMVTSDALAVCHAAVHVAPAITVHAAATTADIFTAVDDLDEAAGRAGSGYVGSAELTTGLYYQYVVIDVPLLISNLAGSRALAADLVRRLLYLITHVTSGARRGATASHARAQFAMVEHGIEQPRSLINAFLSAVDPRKGLLPATYQALASHLREQEAMYGTGEARAHAGMGQLELLEGLAGPRRSLSELMEAAAAPVRGK